MKSRKEGSVSSRTISASVILFIVLLGGYGFLYAKTFPVKYYLEGVPRVENGVIDYYKIPPGISGFRSQAIIFNDINFITELSVNYETKNITLKLKKGSIEDIYPPVTMSMEKYYQQHYRKTFREILREKTLQTLGEKERSSNQGLIGEFTFKLPASVKKSRFARSILGNKAGSLSLDGSEKVTIGGSSSKRNSAGNEEGDNVDFDLTMKQDLILNLRGTIGEKIHVNVDHRSTSGDELISNPSTVEISYEGTEDEIIKRIEGGNISLALSGSKYISYSASSEGLFGIKSDMEIGNLDLTLILGKDEAKKETQKWEGTSRADSTAIPSENYELRKFYYITDPAELFLLYGDPAGDAIFGTDYPPSYEGNAIRTDGGDWILAAGANDLLPNPGTLHVYFDDNTNNNQIETTEGVDILIEDEPQYSFIELLEGTDFTFNYDIGILYVNRSISRQHSIAVIYEQNDGSQIGYYDAAEDLLHVKVIKKSNQTLDQNPDYWKLEARNIYYFGSDYESEDFELYIFDDTASDGTQTLNCPAEIGGGFAETYNDYLRLDTNGDGLINAEDEPVSLASGYLTFSFIEPFYGLGDQVVYEKDPTSVLPEDYIMFISVKGKSGREQVDLEGFNILPGSVKITLGEGATKKDLKENVDFIVDYDFGMVTFLTDEAKDAEAILSITYDHKDLFAVDNTTLAGIRADWDINENATVGGTLIYHNEQVNEDHPAIGGENITLILSDIDGRLEYELPFLTKAIDWLPLINTDETSKFDLSGEMAVSIPKVYGNEDNPEEAYIDDMESILDSYPLGVVRAGWSPASKPYNTDYAKSKPNWFNAQNIYRKNVYNPESLTEDEENEEVPVLGLRLRPPAISNPGMNNRYWGGLMKNIGNQVDLSNKQYIEILVSVDSTTVDPAPVIMHVNLGDINEDFYTEFGGEGILNSEDGVNGGFTDGELDQYGDVNEDIGLDMIPNGQPGDDPDDDFDNDEIGGEYPYINGTEDNDRLDTEDLDNNGELNTTDVYFDYALTLKDTMYLESVYNNWYLYRIPIDDPDSYNIVSNSTLEPNLERINYARIWFEIQDETRINLVNLDLIGNKWEENYIRDENEEIISIFDLESNQEKMQASVVDNQKNIRYTPAPGSVIKEGNEETLEQSMFIDYYNLQPGHNGLVRQKFQDRLSLISYQKIRFWVYSEKFSGNNEELDHDLIIRIGKDSTNYYQISKPLSAIDYKSKMDESGWINVEFDFSELTYLKSPAPDDSSYHYVDTYYSYYTDGDTRYELHKSPTLSYIEEISLGVENRGEDPYNGRVYFNDIRVAYPYDAVGYATRGDMNLKLADLGSIDLSAEWKTDNFKNTAQRSSPTSSNNTYKTTNINMSSKINIHKFFPAQWGFNVPLTLSRTEQFKKGRFMNNSDILWENLNDEDKEREKTHNLKYKADLTLGLNKSPNTPWKLWNGFVDYTFKSTSVTGYIEKKMNKEPTVTDTTLSYQIKHTYNLKLPKDKLSFKILKNYSFGFFPNSFTNSLTYKAELPNDRKWKYNTTGDSAYWEPYPNVVNTKTLNTSSTVKYEMLSDLDFEYSLKTKRDMLLEKYFQDYNIGTEKQRDQAFKIKYSPKYLSNIFSFNANMNIDYDDKTKKKSYDSDDDDFYYEGGVDRDLKTSVTLKNHDLMQQFVNWVWKDKPKNNQQDEDEPPDKGKNRGLPKNHENRGRPEDKVESQDELVVTDSTVIENNQGRKSFLSGINPLKAITEYIGGLENIQFSYENSYSTDYDDLEERPPFEYQLGFPHVLRESDTIDSLTGDVLEKEIEMRQDGNKISASTGFPIMKNLTTQLSYDWQLTQKYTSSPTQTLTVNFPNVRVQLSEFNTLLGIEEVLKSSSLSSSYAVNNKKTGVVDWDEPNTSETTINLSPVLSWSANWVKNITSHINLNHRQTESTTFQETGNIIHKTTSQSATGDVSWSFSAEKGIKIPFSDRRFYIKNDTTLRLDASYERSWGSRIGNDNEEQKDDDQTNFTIKPQISYEFSKSITAGLTSEYKVNNNIKNSIKLTTFSLSMWVEVVF